MTDRCFHCNHPRSYHAGGEDHGDRDIGRACAYLIPRSYDSNFNGRCACPGFLGRSDEQQVCEFCEQPLSEHTVAGACPKSPAIEIDVRLLSPWETIVISLLGAVNELVRQASQAVLARAAIRSIDSDGIVDRATYYKTRE